jgi:Ca2+-binding EF-hand superfamily protein
MSGIDELIEMLNDPVKFEENCKQVFNEIDKNKNGKIEKNEIHKHLNELHQYLMGDNVEEGSFEKLFESLDTDKNGVIDFEEFKPYFKSMLEKMIELLQ